MLVRARADRRFSFDRWAKQGFGEGVSGHISVVDPILPGHYWFNPFGVHFGRISVSNLVLVSPEGYPVEGGAQLPINTAGFHIREYDYQSHFREAAPDVPFAKADPRIETFSLFLLSLLPLRHSFHSLSFFFK